MLTLQIYARFYRLCDPPFRDGRCMSIWDIYGYKTLKNGLSRRSASQRCSWDPAVHCRHSDSRWPHSGHVTECGHRAMDHLQRFGGYTEHRSAKSAERCRHRGDGAGMKTVPLSRTAGDQTLQYWSAALLPRLLAPQPPTCRPTVHHALSSTRDDEVVVRCDMDGSCVSLVDDKQADASVQCK